MAKIKIAGQEETVISQAEFPVSKALELFTSETIAVIGYGIQGSAQALNLRDNGFKVIVGQRNESIRFKRAIEDGWKVGETLFSIEEATAAGSIVLNLLSETAQVTTWPELEAKLTTGKTLCFASGFALTFQEKTKISPASTLDQILVVTRGSGTTARKNFIEKRGFGVSFAIANNFSGRAKEKAIALGIGIGGTQLYETTFKNEAYSDLVGERGILVGALTAMIEAQYELLRAKGHSVSEAFNETVEEFTESLVPLLSERGMDGLLKNCSVTAQCGVLDWKDKFKAALNPVFSDLYNSISSGQEAENILKNSENLQDRLKKITDTEIWEAGKVLRSLRKN